MKNLKKTVVFSVLSMAVMAGGYCAVDSDYVAHEKKWSMFNVPTVENTFIKTHFQKCVDDVVYIGYQMFHNNEVTQCKAQTIDMAKIQQPHKVVEIEQLLNSWEQQQ